MFRYRIAAPVPVRSPHDISLQVTRWPSQSCRIGPGHNEGRFHRTGIRPDLFGRTPGARQCRRIGSQVRLDLHPDIGAVINTVPVCPA